MKKNRKRFAPDQELAKHNIPQLYRWRTLIIFSVMLSFVCFWAFCCRGCIDNSAHGIGFGSGGGSDFGTGPGSGNAGDGPGAGKKGDNKGKFAQAQGTAGIGKDAKPAGTANPSSGQYAIDGAPDTPAAPLLTQPPLHIESIAQEVTPPTPVKVVAKIQTGGAPQGRKGFYGVSVKASARVLYIVDCSGSMGAQSQEIPGKTRIDVMKMELKKAIFGNRASKYSSGGFSIVKFESNATSYPPKKKGLCKYSDQKRMKEAEEFIDQMFDTGGTMMKTAWSAALEIIKKSNVDTVNFLTDGEPGDNFDPAWLQQAVKKAKLRGRLTVNCISIGGHRGLMKKIAEDFKGSYVVIP